MKYNFKTGGWPWVPQLGGDDFIQPTVAVKMKVIDSPLQVHRKKQSHEAEVVIAVQMADEDMVDPVKISLQTHELHLRAFSTIHQEIPVVHFNQLWSGMTSIRWQGTAWTKNCYFKTQSGIRFRGEIKKPKLRQLWFSLFRYWSD